MSEVWNKSSRIAKAGAVVVVGLVALALAGKKDKPNTTAMVAAAADPAVVQGEESAAAQVAPQPSVKPVQSVTLTDRERAFERAMLADDLDVFVKGGKSIFGKWPEGKAYVVASADTLQQDYEKNEAAADAAYRGKRLVIRGTIESIDRSVGENYFLVLRGGTNMCKPATDCLRRVHVRPAFRGTVAAPAGLA